MAWDRQKLEALRTKFSDADGGDMLDPDFRKVANKIFSKAERGLRPMPACRHSSRRRIARSIPRIPISAICRCHPGRADGSGRHQPQRLALRPARLAHHRADRPLQSRARHARRCSTCGSPISATCRSAAASTWNVPRGYRGPCRPDRRRRRRAAVGRRRPFDHPSDPEGGRRATGRSA